MNSSRRYWCLRGKIRKMQLRREQERQKREERRGKERRDQRIKEENCNMTKGSAPILTEYFIHFCINDIEGERRKLWYSNI